MIGYYKTPAKTPVGAASKDKKIRDRVDSEGQYGRWKIRVMGSLEVFNIKLKAPGNSTT